MRIVQILALARYPGSGAPAVVEARHGKGRLVLTGAHVEFDAAGDADLLGWAPGVAPGDGAYFARLVTRLLGR